MGLKLSIVMGVALVIMAGAFKLYSDKAEAEKQAFLTQLQVAAYTEQVLENTIENQNKQLLYTLAKQEAQHEKMRGLERQNQEPNEEVNNFRMKFAKHDLNHLSLRKPGLIENIINKATREVGNDLKKITSHDRPQ